MKKATFETATLIDAVTKASRMAPIKGAAYDKAAGLVFEIAGVSGGVVIKATNLDLTHREEITAVEVGDEDCTWRLPSDTLLSMIASLPIGSGKTVTLTEDDKGWVHMKAGRRKGKLRTITSGGYPVFEKFDESDMELVPDFAARVRQVAWAVDKNAPPMSGVHMDGDRLVATDRYCLATAPCKMPVDEPITAPLNLMTPSLSATMEMKLKVEGKRLYMMPDDYTQISSTIFAEKYPSKDKLDAIMLPKDQYPHFVSFEKQELIDTLTGLTALIKGDRFPDMKVTVEEGAITFYIAATLDGSDKTSELEDTLDVSYEGDEFVFNVNPSFILNAVNGSAQPKVRMHFGPTPYTFVLIEDGDGYAVWISPRKAK